MPPDEAAAAAADAMDSGAGEIEDIDFGDEGADDPFDSDDSSLDALLGESEEPAAPAEATPEDGKAPPAEETEPESTEAVKVKVDGEEREVKQEELVKSYELAQASYKRFEEASKLRKDVDTFVDAIHRAGDAQDYDLMSSIFRQMGADFDSVVEARINHYIEQSKMTPEQREYSKFREEQDRWDRQKAEDAEHARNQQRSVHQEAYTKQFTEEFTEVLQSNNIPVNQFTMGQMTAHVRARVAAGIPYTRELANDMGGRVKQAYLSSFKGYTQGLEGAQLVDAVGSDAADRLRKHQLSQAKVGRIQAATAAEDPEATPAPTKKRKVTSLEEFQERLDGL